MLAGPPGESLAHAAVSLASVGHKALGRVDGKQAFGQNGRRASLQSFGNVIVAVLLTPK